MGKGVLKAVENINTIIAPALIGKDPTEQKVIDDIMIELVRFEGCKHLLLIVEYSSNCLDHLMLRLNRRGFHDRSAQFTGQ